MKVINFFGGPGTGKSSAAMDTSAHMKYARFNVEYINEYAKSVVWREAYEVLKDQLYIFAKQNSYLTRVKDKVAYAITDSPLMLGAVYCPEGYHSSFVPLVWEVFKSYDNINIFLNRVKPYNPVGRTQTEEEAKTIDVRVKKLLDEQGIHYHIMDGDQTVPEKTIELIRKLEVEKT